MWFSRAPRAVLVSAVLGTSAASAGGPPAAREVWRWAESTSSPAPALAPGDRLTDRETELQAHCGLPEAGLRAVAKRVLDRKLRGSPFLDIDGLSIAQRASGEPHVWPRAWTISGRALDHTATLEKLDLWRAGFRDLGERRCGVATGVAADGTQVVAAVAVDALADLAPLPLRTRTGSWLTVDARLLVPASIAHVVVVGPSGTPRNVPTSFENGRVRARFAADRPGAFTVQVVADVATGPRPVIEASVFADVEPPQEPVASAAPGEVAGAAAPDAATGLTRMIDALRAGAELRQVSRDRRLDALATAHARRMLQAHTVGHDVGDGDPAQRVQNAGISASHTGENVAHAPSVALAHRSLYASPSHRANLLHAAFDRVGIGLADDPDGSVWVVELFTSP
jgi:uncharacterized protein YkwD